MKKILILIPFLFWSFTADAQFKKIFKKVTKPFKELVEEVEEVVETGVNVVRDPGNADEHLKKYLDDVREDLEKNAAEGLKITGEAIKIVGEAGQDIVTIQEEGLKAIYKLNDELGDVGADALNIITPEGDWRVDLGLLEIKSNEGIGDRFKQYHSELSQEIKKTQDIINHVQKETFGATITIGDVTEQFATYWGLSIKGFPSEISNTQPVIVNEDMKIQLSKRYTNEIIRSFLNTKYYFGVKKENGKYIPDNPDNFVQFDKGEIIFRENLNTLTLHVSDGRISYSTGDIKASATIKTADIQLIPYILKKDGKFILEIGQRMIFFNMKNSMPKLDKMYAWIIQNEVFGEPLLSDDISDILTFDINDQFFTSNQDISLNVEHSFLVLKSKSLINEKNSY